MLLNIVSFIGRFHPLLVHLPIGFLLLAVIFRFLNRGTEQRISAIAMNAALLLGSLAAIASCITGYLLLQTAEYDEQVSGWHQWLGISIAVISTGWYFFERKQVRPGSGVVIASLVFGLLMITGHLGGTLTHGEGYLSFSDAEDDTAQVVERKPLENVQEAKVYDEVVKPVLASSCYSCHGETKQKGKLRLDIPEMIIKGGKNGLVIEDSADESEMIKRLLLPMSDKKHMPPKDKRQLTETDIALLHWWVEQGSSFDKKVKDLQQPEKIVPVLKTLEHPEIKKEEVRDFPAEPVEKAADAAIQALRKRGIVVLPVSSESNYLTLNFVSTDRAVDKDLELVKPISKQLVGLKLGSTGITDQGLASIAGFSNLVKLQLDNTAITDAGLSNLSSLKNLRELNLVGTAVSAEGLMKLKQVASLRTIYLYKTQVVRSGWSELQKAFPLAKLDSGGYQVPILESDTTLAKPVKKN